MLKISVIILLFIAFCTNSIGYQPYPELSGNREDDKKLINDAIQNANHCNNDGDCGSADFDCKQQYYNNNETTVSELQYKYKNYKYKTRDTAPKKCSTSNGAKKALCRDSKCVPAS